MSILPVNSQLHILVFLFIEAVPTECCASAAKNKEKPRLAALPTV